MWRTEHPGSAWVVAAARALMERPEGSPPRAVTPIDASWSDIIDAVEGHRLTAWIAPFAEALGVPEAPRRRLQQSHVESRGHGLQLVADTAEVTTLLAGHGIPAIVVKGVVLSALAWGEVSAHGAGDVDLLVRPHDVAAVERLLVTRGWRRQYDWLPSVDDSRGWANLLDRSFEIAYDHPSRSGVDVHWRLTDNGNDSYESLLAQTVALPQIGPHVRTITAEPMLVHLAEHGRKEAWPVLRQIVDIARVVAMCDSATVDRLVRSDPSVALAVALAARLAGNPSTCRATRRGNRLLDLAWRNCMSLSWPGPRRRARRGWSAVADQIGMYVWQVHSAPTPHRRIRAAIAGVTPSRGRLGGEPWPVAMTRFARERVLR